VRPVKWRSAFRESHPSELAALKTFIRAKMSYEYENDADRAYTHLQDVVRKDPTNPAYYFQLGIFALKAERYAEGLRAFAKVFECPRRTRQLRRLAHYYRGRTYAHLGKREEALVDLKTVVDDKTADAKLRAAARKAAWRTKAFGHYRLAKRSLAIMMQQSDMVEY
jgi:tetratricopeptide (TPR) repeat protein